MRNDDRDFNQYGGVGRFSYELKPGLKPFVEIEGDNRVHDQAADRNGYLRNSSGGYAKVGSSFEFSRILTGEHWPSDVLGGYLVAAFWLLVSLPVYPWAAARWPRLVGRGDQEQSPGGDRPPRRPSSTQRTAAVGHPGTGRP